MTYAIIAIAAALAYLLLWRKRKPSKTGWRIEHSPGMPARPVPDGDLRSHNGKVWKAKVAHVTHEGWEPSAAAWAVWEEVA